MAYSEKLFGCPRCGRGIIRRASAKAAPLCIDCAVAKAAEAALQIRHRTGPAYRAWVEGMERAAREARARAELDDIEQLRRP